MFRPSRCVKVIDACFVLNNICITRNSKLDENDENAVQQQIQAAREDEGNQNLWIQCTWDKEGKYSNALSSNSHDRNRNDIKLTGRSLILHYTSS